MRINKDTYVSIDHMKDANSSLDPFLWLYDANGMLVQSDDDSGVDRNAKIMLKGSEPSSGISMHLPTGKFHILIKVHNNTHGSYRILVREEK